MGCYIANFELKSGLIFYYGTDIKFDYHTFGGEISLIGEEDIEYLNEVMISFA